jgi:hypothetical protein
VKGFRRNGVFEHWISSISFRPEYPDTKIDLIFGSNALNVQVASPGTPLAVHVLDEAQMLIHTPAAGRVA